MTKKEYKKHSAMGKTRFFRQFGVVSIILLYTLVSSYVFAEDGKLWFKGKVYLSRIKYAEIVKDGEIVLSVVDKAINTADVIKPLEFPMLKTGKGYVFPFVSIKEIPVKPFTSQIFICPACSSSDSSEVKTTTFKPIIYYPTSKYDYGANKKEKELINSAVVCKDSFKSFSSKSFPYPSLFKYVRLYRELCDKVSCDSRYFASVCFPWNLSSIGAIYYKSYFVNDTYFFKWYGFPYPSDVYKSIQGTNKFLTANLRASRKGLEKRISGERLKNIVKSRFHLEDFKKIDPASMLAREMLRLKFSKEGVPQNILSIIVEIPMEVSRCNCYEVSLRNLRKKSGKDVDRNIKVFTTIHKDNPVRVLILKAHITN